MSRLISIAPAPASAVLVFDDLSTRTCTGPNPAFSTALGLLQDRLASGEAVESEEAVALLEAARQAGQAGQGGAEQPAGTVTVESVVLDTVRRTASAPGVRVPQELAHDLLVLHTGGDDRRTALTALARQVAKCRSQTGIDAVAQLLSTGALLLDGYGDVLLQPGSGLPAVSPEQARAVPMAQVTGLDHTLLGPALRISAEPAR